MRKINDVLLVSFILLISLISCKSTTTERVDVTNKLLGNNIHLKVEKTNTNITTTGILTKSNYGTSHSYNYKLTVNDGDIHWDGGSAEPKHILFCNDTTYIHTLKEKYVVMKSKDSIGNMVEKEGYYEIKNTYEAHVDKRYFFKFFGDEFWVEITEEKYNTKKESCNEYDVPNDNELSIPTTVIE